MYKRDLKNIIDYIAKEEDRTPSEIRREMEKAIDMAYETRERHEMWKELFGDRKPTPDEFIEGIVLKLAQ